MEPGAEGVVSRILVVEDEVLLSIELQDQLEELGYRVLGPAGSLGIAHRLLDEDTPDAAILDVNLNGQSVAPVARRLLSQNVPCLIVTAYNPGDVRDAPLADLPKLQKPVVRRDLRDALTRLLHLRRQ